MRLFHRCYERLIYFNLRTGERFNTLSPNQDITEGEQKERTDWDLAFCGYRLRTNSGTSGIGQVLPLIWDMEAMTNGKLFRNYPLI